MTLDLLGLSGPWKNRPVIWSVQVKKTIMNKVQHQPSPSGTRFILVEKRPKTNDHEHLTITKFVETGYLLISGQIQDSLRPF